MNLSHLLHKEEELAPFNQSSNFIFKSFSSPNRKEKSASGHISCVISDEENENGEEMHAKKKRKREKISDRQKDCLEIVFETIQYPDAQMRSKLADQFDTNGRKIQIWFQNRRTKAKVDGITGISKKHSSYVQSQSTKTMRQDPQSSLIDSVESGNLQEVKRLLSCENSHQFLNWCEEKNGYSPLHLAVLKGFREIAEAILSHPSILVNIRNNENYTPLHICSLFNRSELSKMLLKKGANPNVSSSEGYTPLHAAALIGQYQIAKELVENGSNLEACDAHGFTALCFAVREGKEEIVDLLIHYGSSTSITTEGGDTLLHLCHKNPNPEIIKRLMKMGLRTEEENQCGISPKKLFESTGKSAFLESAMVSLRNSNGLIPFPRQS